MTLVSLVVELEAKQKFALIPCTFSPENESEFSISVFSEHDLSMKSLKDGKEVSIQVTITLHFSRLLLKYNI
jgi:hypothetical protein